jgi:ribosomal protein S18 acetylase RimI-like enzyme
MSGAPDIQSIDYHDGRGRRTAVRLLAASVPAECQGLVAYHASNCDAYLAAALAPAPGQRTVCLRAAAFDGEVIAVADWRVLHAQLFLNGISVRAQYRGLGLGGRLLADGARLARDLGIGALGLDVSVDNLGAYALYQKTGFEDLGYSWWEGVPPEPAGPARVPLRILDWPDYEAHRAAYGFGDFSVRHGTGQVSKVRTVGSAMRVEPGPLGVAVAQAVSDLVAPSRIYSIRPGLAAGGNPWFARFVRMRMSLGGAGTRSSAYGQRRSPRSARRL